MLTYLVLDCDQTNLETIEEVLNQEDLLVYEWQIELPYAALKDKQRLQLLQELHLQVHHQ
eukprot:CAMPEP_0114377820 /NCGR_PEP_ID=MMETSP0102-20121206/1245_1 /TAXON_ID=38822 ORGANISM="Pteridomonas danica, Strain PT" /NCGR_SAMPLE_ID=MMETSP0102 /ASSEMBLY_ACC=CAM_ASM_000212 /LENGTH=59 /DNA_ID=CAMNT_0001532511 /DNA_START=333 /DNA_END=509 /DNA_ORIENTATION=-